MITPQITIKTKLKGDRVVLLISNNGPCIPEGDRKRIFDPFFTTQPIGKGPGLGCTISYQIITDQHNRQLNCRSAEGENTEFELRLPLKQTSGSNAQTASQPTTPLQQAPSLTSA